MKHILFSLLLCGLCLQAQAQTVSQQGSTDDEPLFAQEIRALQGHKYLTPILIRCSQGRDGLDSLYSYSIFTYYAGRAKKKNFKRLDEIVNCLNTAYTNSLPECDGGFCHVGSLTDTTTVSETIHMFYHPGKPVIRVGGKGRKYITLRKHAADNPNYRTAWGAEWRLNEGDSLVLSTFVIKGPFDEQRYRQALRTHKFEWLQAGSDSTNYRALARAGIGLEPTLSPFPQTKDQLLHSISVLKGIYLTMENNPDRPNAAAGAAQGNKDLQGAIVKNLNERVAMHLSNYSDVADRVALLNTLSGTPGYYAEITDEKGETKGCSLADLAGRYPTLLNKLFCISWSTEGPSLAKYGERSKNFLLQVYLQ